MDDLILTLKLNFIIMGFQKEVVIIIQIDWRILVQKFIQVIMRQIKVKVNEKTQVTKITWIKELVNVRFKVIIKTQNVEKEFMINSQPFLEEAIIAHIGVIKIDKIIRVGVGNVKLVIIKLITRVKLKVRFFWV